MVTFLGSSVALGTVSRLRQEQLTCWCHVEGELPYFSVVISVTTVKL